MILKNKNTDINAETQVYCIFGNPVKHSLSPAMHNAAFKELGINAVYLAFETGDIKPALQAMKIFKIYGASITIPHKNEVLKYIDNADPLVKEIGALNTLLNDKGNITGYNTDGYGALQALLNNGIRIKNSKILILGNGGAAKAIAFTLLNEGAELAIAGRNMGKVSGLVNTLRKKNKSVEFSLIDDMNRSFVSNFDIIINTTSVGMSPDVNSMPISANLVQKKHTVFDIIYSPHITQLLETSREKGCKIIHGIEMLVNQGAKQFEIWTGQKAPLSVMEKAVKKYIG